MPKIRGVKPDYWTDEAIVDLTIPSRLLLIGLWNYACDNGHLQDKPKQIKMRIFPGDDVNATELLRELEASGRIVRGGGWITIPNLTFHQKPDRRYFTTCDKQGCEDPPEKVSQRESRRVHTVHTASTPGAHGVHTAGALGDCDGEGDGEGDGDRTPLPDKSGEKEESPAHFDAFWETYSKKVDRKKAEAAYRVALKKPGVTAGLIEATAAAYITEQMADGKHPKFTKDPHRWLQGECWRDERTPRSPPRTRVQEHLALVQQLAAEETDPTIPQIGSR